MNGIITKEYQKIVNYLVYLESFAPLVLHHHVSFKDIDDLFGYRFFIAVNNPVIQELELLDDHMYYRGCHKIYKRWFRYRDRRGLDIPLREFSLDQIRKEEAKKNEEKAKLLDYNYPLRSFIKNLPKRFKRTTH